MKICFLFFSFQSTVAQFNRMISSSVIISERTLYMKLWTRVWPRTRVKVYERCRVAESNQETAPEAQSRGLTMKTSSRIRDRPRKCCYQKLGLVHRNCSSNTLCFRLVYICEFPEHPQGGRAWMVHLQLTAGIQTEVWDIRSFSSWISPLPTSSSPLQVD